MSVGEPKPPRLAVLLLRLRLREEQRASVESDLLDLFKTRTSRSGARYARRRYWRDVISVCAHALEVRRGPHVTPRTEREGRSSMDALGQDLVYALRSLRRSPRFTAMVVLTLALGIGANSAVFSVLNAVLLRPLPFTDAGRVVNVSWQGSGYLQALSAIKFQYWHDNARSFDTMATWRSWLGRLDIEGNVTSVQALGVSRDFLQVLGYTPALGRGFAADEHGPAGQRVAVISEALRRKHFENAADVVGRTIRLNDEPVTIVGVLPESFAFPYEDEPVELIVPLGWSVDPNDIAENWPTIARLGKGVTREQAQADVASLTAPFRTAYPSQVSPQDRGMTLATFSELYVAAGVRRVLWILMGAVTLVLLIACANVANLFLARAAQRRGEIALRAALGATPGRITRLVLAESVLVALAAGALGLLLGRWVAGVLVALTPTEVPRMAAVGIDWPVVLFTSLVSLATSLLFGSAAAWPVARIRQSEVLKESTRGRAGGGRVRQGLLVAQSALSMVLLVGAGLLVVTLIGLTRVDPGFDPEGLIAVRLPSKPAAYETSRDLWKFEQGVVQQLEGSSVIASIAAASSLPLERGINTPMSIGGRSDVAGTVEWRAVTPGYFRTLGIALVAGRTFEDSDEEGGRPVAIVNEAFARRYFAESPIGQRIKAGRLKGEFVGPGVEIVGIVADIREVSLRTEPRRTMYVPQAQAPTLLSNVLGTMPVFIARGRFAGGDTERALTEALRAVDPGLPTPQVFPLHDVVARSLARERFGATLLSVLAALALALTAFGIYGVLAYTVRQRRREIGIRMAIGGSRQHVTRLVMRQGIAPVLGGVLLGAVGSIVFSRVVAGFLWGVTATDPATLATVALILLGVAFAACWIPAREAANLDPVRALNCE
ncbi:MAG TPA: ABC transporter permease [Vicinamibacterales bacterium]|nr:ABC transporter permease [Vicinamibacterales bacterium]